VHAVLEAAATLAPVLLVIEDAHWADQSTRDLVSFLFARQFAGEVAIVVSYRSDDLHRRHPLRAQVAEWARSTYVERLMLGPLNPTQVRILVEQLHPKPLTVAEVTDIVDRAEGNAFFVEELVGAACGPGSFVPAELADVLLVRLERLDEVGRRVVRAASAAGRRVSHDLLAAVSGVETEVFEKAVRKAVEMNVLVVQTSYYSFRHALLGEATYDDLLPGERVRLHTAYVAALRHSMGRNMHSMSHSGGQVPGVDAGLGTAADLARHACLAMDFDTALDANIRAGNEAMVRGGPDEAVQHYQTALELLADPRRCAAVAFDVSKLVAHAAEALMLSGHPGRAAAVVQDQLARLDEDAPDAWRARLLICRAAALCAIESDENPLDLSTEAMSLLPEDALGLRAKVLVLHARLLAQAGRYDEAQSIGMDALELAERMDLHALASDAITTLGGLKKTGPKEALRAALTVAVDRAEASGALLTELRGRFHLGRSHEDWAEFDDAASWFRSAITRAEAAGVPWAPYAFESRWQLAWILHVRGRWDEELELIGVSGQTPPPIAHALLEVFRLQVRHARGEEVAAELAQLRSKWPLEGLLPIHASTIEMEIAGSQGEASRVLEIYDAAVAVMTQMWCEWFSARVRMAAVALGAIADALPGLSAEQQTGLLRDADRLHADGRMVLEDPSKQGRSPICQWGPEGQAWARRLTAEWLRIRWLIGALQGGSLNQEPPSAAELVTAWRAAVVGFDDFGHRHEAARARATLAMVLRATGDVPAARIVSAEARVIAIALGATPFFGPGEAAIKEPTKSGTLTPREQEILALVAQGHSNGEIGKQLFISTKTASVHVSNILGKLGASGRTEATAIAHRRGLLTGGESN
jgi:DNA-binding CsgD family transcriptional regulator